MATSTVLSTQLVPFCLRGARLDEPLVEEIIERMPDADLETLSAMLAEVLREEADGGRLGMTNPATGQPASLKSIIFKADADSSQALKVVAFSFSNAAQESLVTLFGLAVTAFFGTLTIGSVGSGLSLLKTLWTNLSLLRSPQDDNAIAVVRALSLYRARDAAEPSTARLQKESALSPTELTAALKQLETRKIIKNTAWGGQAGDFAHADNRWAVRF